MVLHVETATRDTPKSLSARLATLIRMDNRSSGDAFNRAIVDQLRVAADASGKSYWDIADEAGVSRTTITRLFAVNTVNRRSDLKAAYIYALCRVLGLDIVGVMSRAEQRVGDERGDTAPARGRKVE